MAADCFTLHIAAFFTKYCLVLSHFDFSNLISLVDYTDNKHYDGQIKIFPPKDDIEKEEIDGNKEDEIGVLVSIALLLSGAAGLYFGSELFVSSSVMIAQSIGISEFVIGVSIVAFGTSLPELVTSIVAAVRKQNSISIGNFIFKLY